MISGLTSRRTRCRTTGFMTKATRASAARPAPAPLSLARTSARAVGGGRTPSTRSAGCTTRSRSKEPGARIEAPSPGRLSYQKDLALKESTATKTYEAHGGALVDLVVGGTEADELRDRASLMPVVRLSARSLSDLELLAVGGYSPLDGFMTEADYRSVVSEMHLASGLPWPMPITLAVSIAEADAIAEDSAMALAGDLRWPPAPPAGRRDKVRRYPGRRAHALLRSPARELLPPGPRAAFSEPRRHALRRAS